MATGLCDVPGVSVNVLTSLTDRLARKLAARAEAFIWDPPASDVQAAVDRDEELLKGLAARDQPASLVRLWSCPSALVAPRHLARKPQFASARQQCALPLAIRASGGTVVMHGPEFTNLTVITTRRAGDAVDIDRIYASFGDVLFPALREMGISATFAEVRQAYCSGRYDVAVAGRKLAGTAAFVRWIGGVQAHLVHAVLRVKPVHDELAIISAFETAMGLNPSYDPAFLTSLAQECADSQG